MEKFEFILSTFIFYFAFFNSIYAFIGGQGWIFTLMTLAFLIPSFFAYLINGHRQAGENFRLLKSMVILAGFCLSYLTSFICLIWYSPVFFKWDNTTTFCAAVNCTSCFLLIGLMFVCQRFCPANDLNLNLGVKEKIHLFLMHFFFCFAYFCSIYVCVNQHACPFTVISLLTFTTWFLRYHFQHLDLVAEMELELDYLKYREIPCLSLFSTIGFSGFATQNYKHDSVSFILAVLNVVCYLLHFLYIYVIRWDGLDIGSGERSSPVVQEVIASAATAVSNASVPTTSPSYVGRTNIQSPVGDPSTTVCSPSLSTSAGPGYSRRTNIQSPVGDPSTTVCSLTLSTSAGPGYSRRTNIRSPVGLRSTSACSSSLSTSAGSGYSRRTNIRSPIGERSTSACTPSLSAIAGPGYSRRTNIRVRSTDFTSQLPHTIVRVITSTVRSDEQDSQAMALDPPPYSEVVGSWYKTRSFEGNDFYTRDHEGFYEYVAEGSTPRSVAAGTLVSRKH